MASIDSIIKKKEWTGKECGQVYIAKNIYRHELDKYCTWAYFNVKCNKTFENKDQLFIFWRYRYLQNWLTKTKNIVNTKRIEGKLYYLVYTRYLRESMIAENFYQYSQILSNILTDQQRDEILEQTDIFSDDINKLSLEAFFIESNKREFHVDQARYARATFLLDLLYEQKYITAIKILSKEFNVPQIKKLISDKTLVTYADTINGMRECLYNNISKYEYNDFSLKEKKIDVLQNILQDVPYEKYAITNNSIKMSKIVLHDIHYINNMEDNFYQNIENFYSSLEYNKSLEPLIAETE